MRNFQQEIIGENKENAPENKAISKFQEHYDRSSHYGQAIVLSDFYMGLDLEMGEGPEGVMPVVPTVTH